MGIIRVYVQKIDNDPNPINRENMPGTLADMQAIAKAFRRKGFFWFSVQYQVIADSNYEVAHETEIMCGHDDDGAYYRRNIYLWEDGELVNSFIGSSVSSKNIKARYMQIFRH